MIEVKELFDLSRTQAADYLSAFRYPWEALDGIKPVSYTHLDGYKRQVIYRKKCDIYRALLIDPFCVD